MHVGKLNTGASMKCKMKKWDVSLMGTHEKQDTDIEALWIKEAKRRSREIKSGKVKCKPAKDVLREARLKLK